MTNLIKPEEAGKILNCSKRHIYNIIYQGKLQTFREGITRIYKSSLVDYITKHTQKEK